MARLVRRSLGEGGSAASYGAAVLHKSLTMKHCFRLHFITPRQAISFSYEALRLRSVCLDFTQCLTGIYSVNAPKQRTNRERQIL